LPSHQNVGNSCHGNDDSKWNSCNGFSDNVYQSCNDNNKVSPPLFLNSESSSSPNRHKKKLKRRSIKIRDNDEGEQIDWSQFETETDQSGVVQTGIIQSEVNTEYQCRQWESVEELPIESGNTFSQSNHDNDDRKKRSEIVKINSIDSDSCLIVTKSISRHNHSAYNRFSFEYSDDDCYETNPQCSTIHSSNDEINNNTVCDLECIQMQQGISLKECPDERNDINSHEQCQRYSAASSEFYESDGLTTQNEKDEPGSSKSEKRRNSIQKLFKRSHRRTNKNNNSNCQNNFDSKDDLVNFLDNQRNNFQTKKRRKLFPFMSRRKNNHQKHLNDNKPLPTKTQQYESSSLSSFEILENENEMESRILSEEKTVNNAVNITREIPVQSSLSVVNPNIETTIDENLNSLKNEQNSNNEREFPSLQFYSSADNENESAKLHETVSSSLYSKKEKLLAKSLFLKLERTVENLSDKIQLLQIGHKLLRRFEPNATEEDLVKFLTNQNKDFFELGVKQVTKKAQFLSKTVLSILRKRWLALEEIDTVSTTNQIEDDIELTNQITNYDKPTYQEQLGLKESVLDLLFSSSENADVNRDPDFDCTSNVSGNKVHELKTRKKFDLMRALLKRSGNEESYLQIPIQQMKENEKKVRFSKLHKRVKNTQLTLSVLILAGTHFGGFHQNPPN